MWKRHENALQFKVGVCVTKKKQRKVADKCKLDKTAPFETLVNLEAPSAPCPFSGAFNFTYKKENKACDQPRSQVVECMNPSQSLLKFEVCPDEVESAEDQGTVFYNTIIGLEGDTHETLTCRATWPNELDSSETYMMGTLDYRYKRTDDERVRCFLVKDTRRGILVAQSEDGTCYNTLDSAMSGHRTMNLQPINTKFEAKCTFPEWATSMGSLLNFQFSSKYEFINDGDVLQVSNYSSASKKSHALSQTLCVSVEEEDDNYVKMVTRVIANCDQAYKCFRLLKRTDNILEIQEGSLTDYENTACTQHNFDERLMIYTTLFRETLEKQPCPINGIHNVTDLDLDGHTETCDKNGFTNINIKCGDRNTIEFFKACPNPEKLNAVEKTSSTYYHCLGGWEEQIPLRMLPNPYSRGASYLTNYYFPRVESSGRKGLFASDSAVGNHRDDFDANITIGYVVAMKSEMPLDQEKEKGEPPKRICFIYSVANWQGEGSQYSWTVDKTACLRNIRPGHGARQRFNTTVLETCGGRVFQRSPREQVRWLGLSAVLGYVLANL